MSKGWIQDVPKPRSKLAVNKMLREQTHLVYRSLLAGAALLMFTAAEALGQTAAQPPAAPSPAEFIINTVYFFLLAFAVYYMLVIRPGQLKQDSHNKFIEGLKKNDEIVIAGGIYGRVFAVRPDYLTVEIAPNVRVKVLPQNCAFPQAAAEKKDSNEKAS